MRSHGRHEPERPPPPPVRIPQEVAAARGHGARSRREVTARGLAAAWQRRSCRSAARSCRNTRPRPAAAVGEAPAVRPGHGDHGARRDTRREVAAAGGHGGARSRREVAAAWQRCRSEPLGLAGGGLGATEGGLGGIRVRLRSPMMTPPEQESP